MGDMQHQTAPSPIHAPAVTMSPSAAITSVVTPTTMPGETPAITSGLPGYEEHEGRG